MLQIKNLTLSHKKDLRNIITDFNFSLNPGDKAVIIGEEGNGKSTLLKWIYNPELIEAYTEGNGVRILNGEKLAYLPQELPAEDMEKTVYEYFCEEPMFWEQTPKEIKQMTNKLQLAEDFFYEDQTMRTLSGGERIKVQMARIMMSAPTVFLLDEPSNDIDIPTLHWLETWIVGSEQPVLYVSHDETLIENTANVVIHLEQIRRKTISRFTVARMPYREYISQRNAKMNNQMQQALTERRQEKIRQEKFQRIQQKVEQDLNSVSRQDPHGGYLLKKKMKAVKSLEHRYEREAEDMTQKPETEDAIFFKFGEEITIPSGKVILDYKLDELAAPISENAEVKKSGELEEAADGSKPERVLARDISLFIKGQEKVCIIGRNGVGKSTLIKYIAAEMLAREDIQAAYMPQNYEEQLDMGKTPVEYLAKEGDKEETDRIRLFLGSMKYTIDEMNRPISELSGGQKAKVFLLKLSLSGANVLILDEPTRNFSPLSNPVIREVLKAYGGVIISISHDRKYISEVCDKVYELTEKGLKEALIDV